MRKQLHQPPKICNYYNIYIYINSRIGKKAYFLPVTSDHLKSAFVYRESEKSPVELMGQNSTSSSKSTYSQATDGSVALSTLYSQPVNSMSPEMNAKRQKLGTESEVITLSFWKDDQFTCIHSQNTPENSSSAASTFTNEVWKSKDILLLRELIAYLLQNPYLRVSVLGFLSSSIASRRFLDCFQTMKATRLRSRTFS